MNRKLLLPVLSSLLIASVGCRTSVRTTPALTIATRTAPAPPRQPLPTDTPPTVPSGAADESGSASAEEAPASSQELANARAHAGDVKTDVTYCTVEGVDLKMDVYLPKRKPGATPLTVYIHGGGWSKGDKSAGAG